MLRLLLELHNLSGLLSVFMIPKRLASFIGNLDDRDGGVRIVLLVELQHLRVIHLVDMVSGKDQNVFRIIGVHEVDVLGNCVRCSAVYVQVGVRFLTGRQDEDAAVAGIKPQLLPPAT